MPWWGWTLLVLVVIVILPLKFMILKKMLAKSDKENEREF